MKPSYKIIFLLEGGYNILAFGSFGPYSLETPIPFLQKLILKKKKDWLLEFEANKSLRLCLVGRI